MVQARRVDTTPTTAKAPSQASFMSRRPEFERKVHSRVAYTCPAYACPQLAQRGERRDPRGERRNRTSHVARRGETAPLTLRGEQRDRTSHA